MIQNTLLYNNFKHVSENFQLNYLDVQANVAAVSMRIYFTM